MTPPSLGPGKALAAAVLERTPWTRLVVRLESRFPILRVFNYHGTPPRLADAFSRQIDHLLERFEGARPEALETLVREGPGDRSLALFTFDDGLANHLEVAAPALESRGLRGIFCVPAEFPSVPPSDQARWFLERVRPLRNAEHLEDRDLASLSWDGAKELARRGHVICSHTFGHEKIRPALSPDALQREIVELQAELAARLGVAIDGFCWPMGLDERATEAQALVRSHYRWAFRDGSRPIRGGGDPFRIRRTNLEASWPLDVVDFELSGVTDVKTALGGIWRRARAGWRG